MGLGSLFELRSHPQIRQPRLFKRPLLPNLRHWRFAILAATIFHRSQSRALLFGRRHRLRARIYYFFYARETLQSSLVGLFRLANEPKWAYLHLRFHCFWYRIGRHAIRPCERRRTLRFVVRKLQEHSIHCFSGAFRGGYRLHKCLTRQIQ